MKSKSRLSTVLAAAIVAAGGFSAPVGGATADAVERLRGHVDHLTSAELGGRLTGSPGARNATSYIADRLEEIGALPLPGQNDYRLPFEFMAGTDDGGTELTLQVDGQKKPRKWTGENVVQALSFSDNATVSGPVVFAGYGLTVPKSKGFGYDSYQGLDVKDKIVVVLRYYPGDLGAEARSTLARHSGLPYKALNARERGAKAIVVVTGPRSPNAGLTVPMSYHAALSGSGIVAASIGDKLTNAIFKHAKGDGLEAIQESMDSGNPHATGFDIPGVTLTLDVKVDRQRKQGSNVVGYLPAGGGASPATSDYVMLGAHYDHLGSGKHGHSLQLKEEAGKVHRGADDNASGVAMMIETARRLSEKALERPVVLAFWTGGELGLLGSTQFAGGDVLNLERASAYLNFDRVGRLQDNRLNLQSAGSSSVWPGLIERTNVAVGLDINVQNDPYLPTDSSTFYQAGVPSLNFFTGSHEDYHRPTDAADALNYEGLARIARFASSLTRKLTKLDERPDYQVVERNTEAGGDRESVRAFTGTIPDYAAEVEGLLLSGVIEGGPAAGAGLQGGDIIIEFGGQAITNIYDYTNALDAVKIGEPLKVVFLRGGVRTEAELTPTSRR